MDFQEVLGVLDGVLLWNGSFGEHQRCFQGILEVSGVIHSVCKESLGVLEVSGIVEKFEALSRVSKGS